MGIINSVRFIMLIWVIPGTIARRDSEVHLNETGPLRGFFSRHRPPGVYRQSFSVISEILK